MEFEWDEAKAETNWRKYGVCFAEAIAVFEDDRRRLFVDNRFDYGEERLVELGMADGKLLAVTYVVRGDKVRLISARAASRRERAIYGNGSVQARP